MTGVRLLFSRYISHQYRAVLTASAPNMPLTNARDDARVAKAVRYMNTFPGMTVPDAMKLADFLKEEQQDPAKQMWIRRRIKKQTTTSITTPTTSVRFDNAVRDSGGVSSLSTGEIASPLLSVFLFDYLTCHNLIVLLFINILFIP